MFPQITPRCSFVILKCLYEIIVCTFLFFQVLLLNGCNTYTTLDPRAPGKQQNGVVDQTAEHYGQPYFLPKGLIRLVIKPEAAPGGAGGGSSSAAANANSVTINNFSGATPSESPGSPTTKSPAGAQDVAKQKEGAKEDDLVTPVAYAISVTRVIVPDQSQGPFTAKYNTNWFYSDNINIGVTDDGLLTTLTSDISDRTSQIIYNVADTAKNAVEAAAYLGSKKGAPRPARAVRYRRLNIDVTFDPFNESDVRSVKALFNDVPTDEALYLSPFKFNLSRVQTGSMPGERAYLFPRKPKAAGLWFRELTPVEVILSATTPTFIKQVRSQRRLPIRDEAKRAELKKQRDQLVANAPADSASPEEKKKYKDALVILNNELNTLKGVTSEQLSSTEETAISQEISRAVRLVVTVPNKERTFAFNIPRNAFVQNKKLNLTISSGLLTKVELLKPSEAEGFSQIPLTVSQKILQLPKDLLSIRTEQVNAARDQAAAANAAFNSQQQLQQSTASRQDALKTAELTAEKNRLQAEIDVLKKQKELIQVQGTAPTTTPTPSP